MNNIEMKKIEIGIYIMYILVIIINVIGGIKFKDLDKVCIGIWAMNALIMFHTKIKSNKWRDDLIDKQFKLMDKYFSTIKNLENDFFNEIFKD